MSTRRRAHGTLLLGLLSGCILIPQKDTCGSGLRYDEEQRSCVPRGEDRGAAEDMAMPLDLSGPDLSEPDLMPDLRVECIDESECTGARAGLACKENRCVPCAVHMDCVSQTCDPYLPEVGTSSKGRCVPTSEIVYLDNNPIICNDTKGDKPDEPVCTIAAAIMKLAGTKTSIRAAGSLTSYGPVTLANKSVRLYGPAGESTASARFGGDVTKDGVVIDGNSQVVLYGVEINGARQGITCGSTTGSVKLRRSQIIDSFDLGMNMSGGCKLEIDRAVLRANKNAALRIESVQNYIVTNSFFIKNLSTNPFAAIRISADSTGLFRFNTIADNVAAMVPAGIDCGAAERNIEDTIIFGNSAQGATQLSGRCNLQKTVIGMGDSYTSLGAVKMNPMFESAAQNDYRLKNVSDNETCCVNQAQGMIGYDHFGTARPLGGGYDIGAHELK